MVINLGVFMCLILLLFLQTCCCKGTKYGTFHHDMASIAEVFNFVTCFENIHITSVIDSMLVC